MIVMFLKLIIIGSLMFDSLFGLSPDPDMNYNIKMKKLLIRQKLFEKCLNQTDAQRDSVRSLIDLSDVIHLNVRGQRISTRRRTLIKRPNSTLAAYFNESSNEKLQPDYNERYLLDYNPLIFTRLLNQLQDLHPKKKAVFHITDSSTQSLVSTPRPAQTDDNASKINQQISKTVTKQTATNDQLLISRVQRFKKHIGIIRKSRSFFFLPYMSILAESSNEDPSIITSSANHQNSQFDTGMRKNTVTNLSSTFTEKIKSILGQKERANQDNRVDDDSTEMTTFAQQKTKCSMDHRELSNYHFRSIPFTNLDYVSEATTIQMKTDILRQKSATTIAERARADRNAINSVPDSNKIGYTDKSKDESDYVDPLVTEDWVETQKGQVTTPIEDESDYVDPLVTEDWVGTQKRQGLT